MRSWCRFPVAKTHNFGQILTFVGLLYRPPLPMRAKFSALEQTHGVHLHLSKPDYVVLTSGRYNVCRPYSIDQVATFRLDIGLFCRPLPAKTPNFCHFWISAFCDVASWHQYEKVEHGTQLQTFPYRTASKSFLYSNVFVAKQGAQTLTFKSVTNRQTDRQTDR